MRLIAWNCKGGFKKKHSLMSALHPDVVVVPESERITELNHELGASPVRSMLWFGSQPRKGLGVVSYGEYSMEVHPSFVDRHKWIVPVNVKGPTSFLLFAVWTLPVGAQRLYVPPLIEAFETYRHLMDQTEVIWAGDFNAAYLWDKPSRKYKFRDFVHLLGRCGLHSMYHKQAGCDSGGENDQTFFLQHNAKKGYHIDYVFASSGLHRDGCQVSVGTHQEWATMSDHMPVICDFDEKH
jgi:exonuclease III